MAVDFGWLDDSQTVMAYRLMGLWNWAEYHQGVRASLFAMHQHAVRVHSWLDLSASERPHMPAGVVAHAQTFGKRLTPALSGYAVVLAAPASVLEALQIVDTRRLPTPDGAVLFAHDAEAARAWLRGV